MILNVCAIMVLIVTAWMVSALVLLGGLVPLVMHPAIMVSMDQDASLRANAKTEPLVTGMESQR